MNSHHKAAGAVHPGMYKLEEPSEIVIGNGSNQKVERGWSHWAEPSYSLSPFKRHTKLSLAVKKECPQPKSSSWFFRPGSHFLPPTVSAEPAGFGGGTPQPGPALWFCAYRQSGLRGNEHRHRGRLHHAPGSALEQLI